MMDKVKDIDWSPCPQDACPVVKTLNSRAGQPECGSWFCHLLAEQRWPRCFPLYASVTTSVEWPQQPSLNHRTIRRIKWANSCKPLWRVAGTWQTLYKCLLHKFKKNGWSSEGEETNAFPVISVQSNSCQERCVQSATEFKGRDKWQD